MPQGFKAPVQLPEAPAFNAPSQLPEAPAFNAEGLYVNLKGIQRPRRPSPKTIIPESDSMQKGFNAKL